MEFKGTKGKWELAGISGRMIKSTDTKELGFIADVDTRANALLISKAPEMLDMLKEYVRLLDGEFSPKTFISELVEKSQILIKEATEL
jgi:type II secretory pathway component GspD/PulD (secretin)